MSSHLAFALHEPSQVGEARRAAARLAEQCNFDDTLSGRLALVVTELGTNLVRHAQGGRLLMAAHDDGSSPPCVELLSIDDGPGMADVASCLRDGYSSGGTPGTGLGAVRRLADDFSITSTPGQGTIVAARLRAAAQEGEPPRRFCVAALCINAPGEAVCGDAYAVRSAGDGLHVMVADGLGHGPGAQEASLAAVKVFETASADNSPAQVLERAHGALRATRGAAVALVHLDARQGKLVFAGAGNIAGRLVSGVQDRSLLSQHGTVGLQIRRLQDTPYEWPEHSLLILHSDGVATRWTLADTPGLLQCDPLVIAAWLVRQHSRGRDDVTVVVIRRT